MPFVAAAVQVRLMRDLGRKTAPVDADQDQDDCFASCTFN